MKSKMQRRGFLKRSLATAAAAPLVISMEEHRLVARAADAPAPDTPPVKLCDRWMGKIGGVSLSRLICGGNLISGYAHSRDLIYVSNLLKHYFSDERIMETWRLCEQHGINTMIFNPSDQHAVDVYDKYRAAGGKIQYLAQLDAKLEDPKAAIEIAANSDAVGAFLVGNCGDRWAREGRTDAIKEFVWAAKNRGMIAGVAGHEVRTPMACEKAGIEVDFYVKTLHHTNYWSTRRPDQEKDVIDNYAIDNYWCRDPKEAIEFMAGVKKPWIAYKVLAAGAIRPKSAFEYAFANGADFALAGMFDFQVAEDVAVANEVLAKKLDRKRAWMA